MNWWLFLGATVATGIIWFIKRALRSRGKTKSFGYFFVMTSAEVIMAFDLALLFWIVLWVLVQTAWHVLTLNHLITIETYLSTFRNILDQLRLDASKVFIGLLIIYLLSLVKQPLIKRLTPALIAILDKYHRTFKLAYMLIVFITSLTLLGTQFGGLSNEIKLHIKVVRNGYASLCQETKETLSDAAVRTSYINTLNAMPPQYVAAVRALPKLTTDTGALKQYYENAKKEHAVRSTKVDVILHKFERKKEILSKVAGTLEATKSANDWVAPELSSPEKISHKKIETARTAVARYRSRLSQPLLEIFTTEEGRRLSHQLPRVFTYSVKTRLFSELVKADPILGPVIDMFVDSIDQKIKSKLESVVEPTIKALASGTGNAETVLTNTVNDVVVPSQSLVPATTKQAAMKVADNMDNDLRAVVNAKADVDKVIEESINSKAHTHITQLYNNKENIREQACDKLCKLGNKLSKQKVTKLTEIMRNGQESWPKFLYREHHCEWYEDTSVKYYAARVVSASNSPAISPALRTEAERWLSEGKTRRKVTDPGWV
ncbi:MAG: hypothetical protein A2511_04295 [Deltaproteobacteria bacterium RIFOXYD12_FULL_50_9]|nr:MAG: hypothetical protein A2511_04295 [Deltaproteobacteria bacterium RIFOXYD12_FULL_50_9]